MVYNRLASFTLCNVFKVCLSCRWIRISFLYYYWTIYVCFPGGSAVKNLTANACQDRRWEFEPWVRKIPWRRAWQPTPVFLCGESHGQRNMEGYNPWGCIESEKPQWLQMVLQSNCTILCFYQQCMRVFLYAFANFYYCYYFLKILAIEVRT